MNSGEPVEKDTTGDDHLYQTNREKRILENDAVESLEGLSHSKEISPILVIKSRLRHIRSIRHCSLDASVKELG